MVVVDTDDGDFFRNCDVKFTAHVENLLRFDVVAGHDADRARQAIEPIDQPAFLVVPGI